MKRFLGLVAVPVAVLLIVFLLAAGHSHKLEAFNAVARNDVGKVEQLLAKGFYVDSKGADGATLLLWAIYGSGKEDVKPMVEMLIAHHADVSARNNMGVSPLHNAAYTGREDLAELLIANGADINARTNDGRTPLSLAMRMHNNDVASLLRKHGGR